MSKQKSGKRMNGKGYYIALVLCAVAIGISGYLYYRNANEKEINDPSVAVSATQPEGVDVQAVATQPNIEPTAGGTVPQGTKPVVRKPIRTAAPVEGQTVAAYAMDMLSYNATTRDWRTHNGMDIAAEAGTTVCAAADGTVYSVHEDERLGTTVVIQHDGGYTTCYSSLDSQVQVAPGDVVRLGQAIGRVGQSALLESAIGEHVHFSVSCDGTPVDPEEFLGWAE